MYIIYNSAPAADTQGFWWGGTPSATAYAVPAPPKGGALGLYPLSLLTAFAASSPKGTPYGNAGNFAATAEAVPLGKVSSPQAMTEGVSPKISPPLQ